MADVILILVLAVLVGLAVLRIYRTVRYGGSCCGSGTETDKKVRVKDRNKANYPYQYKLKVEGMVCAGCVRKVENLFNSDGELWAKVDLERKEARILSKREMSREDFWEMLKTSSYTLMDVE